MSELKKYIIKDNETQYDSSWGDNDDILYDIYGISDYGILFERDLKNPDRILKHFSNGVKYIDYMMSKDEHFFRKNKGSKFWASYEDYDDYTYSKEPKELSKEEMIATLKEYIYLHFPSIGNSTCMGWSREDGDKSPIHDPNWCYALIQLDDKKDYTIIKRRDTVKLFRGDVSMYHFDDHDELAIVKFKLDRDLYEKALRLTHLRRLISTKMYGKVDTSKLKEFISLQELISLQIKITAKI